MQIGEILSGNWMMKTVILTKEDHSIVVGELVGIIRDSLMLESEGMEISIKCDDVLTISEAGEKEKNGVLWNQFSDCMENNRYEEACELVKKNPQLENFETVDQLIFYVKALKDCGHDYKEYYRRNCVKVSLETQEDFVLTFQYLQQEPDNMVAGQFMKQLQERKAEYIQAACEMVKYSCEHQKTETFWQWKTRVFSKYMNGYTLEQLQGILEIANPIPKIELVDEENKQEALEQAVSECLQQPLGFFNALLLEKRAGLTSQILTEKKEKNLEEAEKKLQQLNRAKDKSLYFVHIYLLSHCNPNEEQLEKNKKIFLKMAQKEWCDAIIEYQHEAMGKMLQDSVCLEKFGYTKEEVDKYRKLYQIHAYPMGDSDYDIASRLHVWGLRTEALEYYKKALNSDKKKESLNQIINLLMGMKKYDEYIEYYNALDNSHKEREKLRHFYLEALYYTERYESLFQRFLENKEAVIYASVWKCILLAGVKLQKHKDCEYLRYKLLEQTNQNIYFWKEYLCLIRENNEEEFKRIRSEIMFKKGFTDGLIEKATEVFYSIDGIWQQRKEIEYLRRLPKEGDLLLVSYFWVKGLSSATTKIQKEFLDRLIAYMQEKIQEMEYKEVYDISRYLLKDNYENSQIRELYEVSEKGKNIFEMLGSDKTNYTMAKRLLMLGFEEEKAFDLLKEEIEQGTDKEQIYLCAVELVNGLEKNNNFVEILLWGEKVLVEKQIYNYPVLGNMLNRAYETLEKKEEKEQLILKLQEKMQEELEGRNFEKAIQIKEIVLILDPDNRKVSKYSGFFSKLQSKTINLNEDDILGQANIILYLENDHEKYVNFLEKAFVENLLFESQKPKATVMLLEHLEEIGENEKINAFILKNQSKKYFQSKEVLTYLGKFFVKAKRLEEGILFYENLLEITKKENAEFKENATTGRELKIEILQKLRDFYEEATKDSNVEFEKDKALWHMEQLLQMMPDNRTKLCYVELLLVSEQRELAQQIMVLFLGDFDNSENEMEEYVKQLMERYGLEEIPNLDTVFKNMVKTYTPYNLRRFSEQYKHLIVFNATETNICNTFKRGLQIDLTQKNERYAVIKSLLQNPGWYKAWVMYQKCLDKNEDKELLYSINANLYVVNTDILQDKHHENALKNITECRSKHDRYHAYYFLYRQYLRNKYIRNKGVKSTIDILKKDKKTFKITGTDQIYKKELAKEYIDLFRLMDDGEDYIYSEAARYIADNSGQEEYFYGLFKDVLLYREQANCIKMCVDLSAKRNRDSLIERILNDISTVGSQHSAVIELLREYQREGKEDKRYNEIWELLASYPEEPKKKILDEKNRLYQKTGIDAGIWVYKRLQNCFVNAQRISYALLNLYQWSHDEKYFEDLYWAEMNTITNPNTEKVLFNGSKCAIAVSVLEKKEDLCNAVINLYEKKQVVFSYNRLEELKSFKKACQGVYRIYKEQGNMFAKELLHCVAWNNWGTFIKKYAESWFYSNEDVKTILAFDTDDILAEFVYYLAIGIHQIKEEQKVREKIKLVDQIVKDTFGQSIVEISEKLFLLNPQERSWCIDKLKQLKKSRNTFGKLNSQETGFPVLMDCWDFCYGQERVRKEFGEYAEYQNGNYVGLCEFIYKRYEDMEFMGKQIKALYRAKEYSLVEQLYQKAGNLNSNEELRIYRGAALVLVQAYGVDLYIKELRGKDFINVVRLLYYTPDSKEDLLLNYCNIEQKHIMEMIKDILKGNGAKVFSQIEKESTINWKELMLQLIYANADEQLKEQLLDMYGENVTKGEFLSVDDIDESDELVLNGDRSKLPKFTGIKEISFIKMILEKEAIPDLSEKDFEQLKNTFRRIEKSDTNYHNLEPRKSLLVKLILLAQEQKKEIEYMEFCTYLGVVLFWMYKDGNRPYASAILLEVIENLNDKSRQGSISAVCRAFLEMLGMYEEWKELVNLEDKLTKAIEMLEITHSNHNYNVFINKMKEIIKQIKDVEKSERLIEKKKLLEKSVNTIQEYQKEYDDYNFVYRRWAEILRKEIKILDAGVVFSIKMETQQCSLNGEICGVIRNLGNETAQNVTVRILLGENMRCGQNEIHWQQIYGQDTKTMCFKTRGRGEAIYSYVIEVAYDCKGERIVQELEFEVQLADKRYVDQEIVNKYSVEPVDNDQDFHGRKKEKKKILDYLHNKKKDPILIRGLKRVGKTSYLLYIKRMLQNSDEHIAIYRSCHECGSKEMVKALFVDSVMDVLDLQTKNPIKYQQYSGFEYNKNPEYLVQFYRYLEESEILQGKKILLMVDEIEELFLQVEKHNNVSAEIYDKLRFILQMFNSVRFMFCGADYLTQFIYNSPYSAKVNALFENTQPWIISRLDKEAANKVVTKPAEGMLRYTPEALERIWYFTAGHTFYIKKICGEIIWNLQMAMREDNNGNLYGERDIVYAKDVDKAAEKVWSQYSNMSYLSTKEFLTEDERILVRRMCDSLPWAGALVSHQKLKELEEISEEKLSKNLQVVIDRLLFKDIIVQKKDGYRFSTEMFRRWYSVKGCEEM